MGYCWLLYLVMVFILVVTFKIGRNLWLYHTPFNFSIRIYVYVYPRKDSYVIGPSSRIVVVAATFYWSRLGKSFVEVICSCHVFVVHHHFRLLPVDRDA